VKIIADTNVLIRVVTEDDPAQCKAAQAALARADAVAIATPVLCELAWVLAQGYSISPGDIGKAIRIFINSANVLVNRSAAEAGLAMLDTGGDFADGAIAFEGRSLGGEVFVSFDRQAVKLLESQGASVRLL
jgi:predicted nucleic-acid-binding protein